MKTFAPKLDAAATASDTASLATREFSLAPPVVNNLVKTILKWKNLKAVPTSYSGRNRRKRYRWVDRPSNQNGFVLKTQTNTEKFAGIETKISDGEKKRRG